MLQRMTKQEIERIRGLATRLGVPDAAKALGISRQSLLALLAGTGVKDGTEAKIEAAIKAGAIDSTQTRGETRSNAPKTKRRA